MNVGKFPARGGHDTQDAKTTLLSLLLSGMMSNLYFDFVNSWWKVKNAKNVLLLHYMDAKRDLSG